MRDYKNVKVPKKYRTGTTRQTVKPVEVRRGGRRQGKSASGAAGAMLKILGFTIIASCCWAGWQGYRAIAQAEIFQISGVDVKGVRHLVDADLKNIVGPFTGQNIFRADLEAAVRRARANPWVKDVRIHRSLPNRITMDVVERVPYAVLDAGAARYFMDNQAVVIDRVPKDTASAQGLPVVLMRDYRAQPGEPVMSEGISEALTLLAEIEARGGWNLPGVTIKAGSPESLSVVYADHEFKIGSGRYDEKLRRLAEVMADVKQRGLNIAYVDLRPESQAAVMVKSDGVGGHRARGNGKN